MPEITLDKEGKPIEIQLDNPNEPKIFAIEFPLPTKPINLIQMLILRRNIGNEMRKFITSAKPPKDPFEAAKMVANKLKEVLTKYYNLYGLL